MDFSTRWLDLREHFDHAARAISTEALGLRTLRARSAGNAAVLRVLDLACGTGSNLRMLAPRLGGEQHWCLVDKDQTLLDAMPDALLRWAWSEDLVIDVEGAGWCIAGRGWRAVVETQRLDLARELDALPLAGRHLVTASALLDLVGADWFDALARASRAAGAAMLFALDVDGRVAWEPSLGGDAEVLALFARHQRRDKGFGPALGPKSAPHVLARLRALGYVAVPASSDWLIEGSACPQAIELQHAMIEGMARAASEVDASARTDIEAWRRRRWAMAPISSLEVGHCDLLAVLEQPDEAASGSA